MEDFIERAHALLTARPETARVTMVYTHKNATSAHAPGERVEATAKPAKFVFKAFCPNSGLCYKYKAKKANELSRILASLSPHMFEFGASRKRGISSVLSDTIPEDEAATSATASTNAQQTAHDIHKEPVAGSAPEPKQPKAETEKKSSKSKKKKGKKH